MQKILIINLAGIGDMLLSTPALRALRKSYPEAEISMLVTNKVYGIVKDLAYIDKIFLFKLGYGGIMPLARIFGNLKTLLVLRSMHFDLAVNMRTLVSVKGARKIKFLLDFISPEKTAGRDTAGRGYFFDIRIPEKDLGAKFEMEYDIDTVRALGAEVLDRTIDFKIEEKVTKKVDGLLEKAGFGPRDCLIGVYPGGMPSRQWPIENFAHVIDRINKIIPSKFVIALGKSEVDLADKLIERTNVKMINFTGMLNVKELGALIKRCKLFITNDTGPMHIAAILNIPLVAIRGSSDFMRFDPRNISNNAVVLYKKVDCAPCEKVSCDDLKCMKAILPEEVEEAMLSMLNRNS